MNLNELVEAAIAKALGEYIATRGTLDDAFLDKLAEKIAKKVGEAEKRIEKRAAERYEDAMREMQRQFDEAMRAAQKQAAPMRTTGEWDLKSRKEEEWIKRYISKT